MTSESIDPSAVEIVRVSGSAIKEWLDEVAELRIEVFREFPYLYDGDESHEREYLAEYGDAEGGILVLAKYEGAVVGAATGMPLADADQAFRAPFEQAGLATDGWFYFGESVLRPEFRGYGFGHRFFDEREAHAHASGFPKLTFCAVIRPSDHPLKPEDARSHEKFWSGRNFQRRDDLVARLSWKQVDGHAEAVNDLVFWVNEGA